MYIVTLNGRPVASFHYSSDAQAHIDAMNEVIRTCGMNPHKHVYQYYQEGKSEEEEKPKLEGFELREKMRAERLEAELAKSRREYAAIRASYKAKRDRNSRRKKK